MSRHPFGMAKNSRLESKEFVIREESFEIFIPGRSLVDTRSVNVYSHYTFHFIQSCSLTDKG